MTAQDAAARAATICGRSATMPRRMMRWALMLCAFPGFVAAPAEAEILFAADAGVPRPVQEFAWRVIETRCAYQRYELGQRSFWAYDARVRRIDASVVYSIKILSEPVWKKTEPPDLIEMTVVDDGRVRLTALKSSFSVCAP
jgi:hypothetical protein